MEGKRKQKKDSVCKSKSEQRIHIAPPFIVQIRFRPDRLPPSCAAQVVFLKGVNPKIRAFNFRSILLSIKCKWGDVVDKGLNERKPPTHLKKVGKDTWIRIWSVLEGEGKADINDPIVVEAIAFSYQMFREMAANVKKKV